MPDLTTPYELLGGSTMIRRIVDRFYDLMESDPAFAELRALHDPDLAPMRASLCGFLIGWTGGPRDWFAEHQGRCMMSIHAGLEIGDVAADQWCTAMARALVDSGVEAALAKQLNDAFARMALAMAGGR